jgi:hypothetical protein
MSEADPIWDQKIHGFGAFHQRALFFLRHWNRSAAKDEPPDADDAREFLEQITMMRALFDVRYRRDADLPAALHTERDAWTLLSPHVKDWINRFTAALAATPQDPVTMRQLHAQCTELFRGWGVISSSYKAKEQHLTETVGADIAGLIETLRAGMGDSTRS